MLAVGLRRRLPYLHELSWLRSGEGSVVLVNDEAAEAEAIAALGEEEG
jgi:hypothetical protein